ncbi:hypothetical protein SCP_1700860 [Sparassis crispa]|uniref:Uncharacterized protein n=1 Tax=Sparassis crispa TaxID=139825 RepID=A0A401H5U5_9APHY|nr:hypothetical protein SCP_1700860 [Sparassis crispa]GBE89761.1 hypothetical protein SCP_1700860 [Sparassis crispa]
MALGPSSAHQLLATEPRAERAGLSRTRAAQLECAITAARARAPSSKLAQLPRIDLGPCAALFVRATCGYTVREAPPRSNIECGGAQPVFYLARAVFGADVV